MKFSPMQEKALIEAARTYKNGDDVVISGIAGSGKSTIVKTLTEDLLGLGDLASYGTLTGRAAKVLRLKGLPAMTLHRLLYDYKRDANNRMYFVLKSREDIHFSVIIIDELSMVPLEMIKDLRSLGVRIIGMGDPFQLEAIGSANNLLNNPTYFLSEPHRQALESPIFYWANVMRTEKRLPTVGQHGTELFVANRLNDLPDNFLFSADIILCGYNRTRVDLNTKIRAMYGREGEVQSGDKIIFTANNYNALTSLEEPVVNGGFGTVKKVGNKIQLPFERYDPFLRQKVVKHVSAYEMLVEGDSEEGLWDIGVYANGIGALKKDDFDVGTAVRLDYGHAITIHKSQGSEFDKVIMVNQTFGQDAESKMKMSYTGITRAKEKCIFCLKG